LSLASDKRGNGLQRYLKQFLVFGKALTNCFIMPNLIWRGGISIFFGSTRLLRKMMFFNHKLATDIAKRVWRVHTTTTWHVQSTTQYKIKLSLKNETALAGSLEHEEVLSRSLLYFFSTAMLVQKIATKGANSV
jgi:hypothetical protein